MRDRISRVLKSPATWLIVVYLLVPVDLVPDSLPVIGTADDLLVILLLEMLKKGDS